MWDKNSTISLVLILGGLAICFVPVFRSSGGIGFFYVGIIIFLLGLCWNRGISQLFAKKTVKKLTNLADSDNSANYYSSSQTLSITKRSQNFSKLIHIVNDKNISVSYEPVKLHVGAATVGGVTTGGAYTTGGYNYISGVQNSGKYHLEYIGQTIKTIELSDELYLQAQKNSKIASYIHQPKRITVIEDAKLTDTEARMLLAGIQRTGVAGSEFAYRGHPDFEKCRIILDWLCNPEISS